MSTVLLEKAALVKNLTMLNQGCYLSFYNGLSEPEEKFIFVTSFTVSGGEVFDYYLQIIIHVNAPVSL